MADIAASGVTYTPVGHTDKVTSSRRDTVFVLGFGNGVDTYPAGGIPLIRGNFGMPNQVEVFDFQNMANSNGFIYKYDPTNFKIRIYQGDNDAVADGPMVELGNVAVAATSLSVHVVGW